MAPKTPTIADILDRVTPEPNTGCWLWTGHVNFGGYGRVSQRNISRPVHRVIYEAFKGVMPEGTVIDHLCRVRLCCNPDHLEAVTQRENVRRGIGVAAVNMRKDACQRGHPYEPDNLCPSSLALGRRDCLICRREREARRWLKKKGTTKHV